MRAGKLRHLATFIEPDPSAAENELGHADGWRPVATDVPAGLEDIRGKEDRDADKYGAELSHKVWIRYHPDIAGRADLRVQFRGRTLDVHAVVNWQERDRWLIVLCDERQS